MIKTEKIPDYVSKYLKESELNESDVNCIYSMITEEITKYSLCGGEANPEDVKFYVAKLYNLKTEIYNIDNGKSSDNNKAIGLIKLLSISYPSDNSYNFFNELNCLFEERYNELNERQEQ